MVGGTRRVAEQMRISDIPMISKSFSQLFFFNFFFPFFFTCFSYLSHVSATGYIASSDLSYKASKRYDTTDLMTLSFSLPKPSSIRVTFLELESMT